MDTPIFLDLEDIVEMHAEQLALYGGREGIRDQASRESAVCSVSIFSKSILCSSAGSAMLEVLSADIRVWRG
jgi:hypothetical protein